jgi:hypothetical protein
VRNGIIAVLLVSVIFLAVPPSPAAAQAVTVLVDGALVPFDQPPVIVGGRVLIPLRGVFERLGALVEWQAESRTVIARRGTTMIVLQPGVSSARVNDRDVSLDVPPMITGGRTLVPLRFISEALGAAVDWDAARRIVYVASPRVGQPPAPPPMTPRPLPPPEPIQPPPALPPTPPETVAPPLPPIIILPPPPPAPAQPIPARISGTVIRVEAYQSRLFIRSDGFIYRISVGPGTAIFLTEASTGRGGAAGLDDIRRGDLVRVTVNAQGGALSINASYMELSSRLDNLVGRTIHLRDGRAVRLGDEPLFFLDGREVTRDHLRPGMDVVLRVSPQTGEAWEIRARSRPEPPRPPMGPPRIESLSVSPDRPLGIGDTLVVTMYGTPGGAARFEIARVDDEVLMTEGPAGQYTGRRTIRAGESAQRAIVTVRLRIGGIEASRVAREPVTVDGFPPEITRRVPEPNSVTTDTRPTIVIGFTDRGPVGIDRASFRLWINGQEIRRAVVSDTAATYEPASPLPFGRIRVQARIADQAGNEATTAWTFEIERASPPTRAPTPTVAPTAPPTPPPATPSPTFSPTPAPPPVTPTPTIRPTPAPPLVTPTPTIRPTPAPPPVLAPPSPTPSPQVPTTPPPTPPSPTPASRPVQPPGTPTPAATATGRVLPPVILEPKPQDTIRVPLVVRGTAAAGHRVEVTVEYQASLDGSTVTIGPVTDDVDKNGRWTVRIRLPSPLPRSGRLTIIAFTVSPSGARSEPVRLVLAWPRE